MPKRCAKIETLLFTGTFFTGALLACSGPKEHPEFIGDDLSSGSSDDAENSSCDAGDCEGLTSPALAPPDKTLHCLEEEALQDVEAPLTGVVEAFASDYFHPRETEPVAGDYTIKTLGVAPLSMACAQGKGGEEFSLLGGTEEDGGRGPLLIVPEGHDNFWTTVINKSPTRDFALSVVPVFRKDEVEKIFAETGIEPKPEKSQIVVEFVFVDQFMKRSRLQELQLGAGAAEQVAYRSGGEWTLEANQTGPDGLAALLNVNAGDEGLGIQVDAHYVNKQGDGERNSDGLKDIWSYAGAATYVAVTPEEN